MKITPPLTADALVDGIGDDYAKRRIKVEDGDADLYVRDLPFNVTSHERLAHQLHALQLRLNAA